MRLTRASLIALHFIYQGGVTYLSQPGAHQFWVSRAGKLALRILSLPSEFLDYRYLKCLCSFCMALGDLNSGPHPPACCESSLPTEQSLQPFPSLHEFISFLFFSSEYAIK